jgi:hypothetical protein
LDERVRPMCVRTRMCDLFPMCVRTRMCDHQLEGR